MVMVPGEMVSPGKGDSVSMGGGAANLDAVSFLLSFLAPSFGSVFRARESQVVREEYYLVAQIPLGALVVHLFVEDIFQVPTLVFSCSLNLMGEQPEVLLGVKAMLGTVKAQATYGCHVQIAVSTQ